MIPIEKEPEDLYKNTKVYEHCMFCDNQTNMWNIETNKPVCTACSKVNNVEDIPKYDYE